MARIIPIPIGPVYDGGPCRGMIHVVKAGDTLYQLGKQYHVSVGQLMFANPFVNVYNLQIGDELCIPVSMARENQNEEQPWEMTPQPWKMDSRTGEAGTQSEEMTSRPWEMDFRTREAGTQSGEMESRPWEKGSQTREMTSQPMDEEGIRQD